ncbi:2-oxo-tetronate isomerase [Granulicella sp. S156]|jgi:2-dehydrotetronate isomerase|uniref:2-oxo-tetronate isomerase n=1 Tax=Granulicella sp. S156 TaxID=1747224 RepID=UPI00131E3333|nr:2-oxo-tetronate isomerase [Granulicella sp. S156]
MPKFAANLSMMFNEVPFLERFAAAANAGFTGVEYLFPYEFPTELIAAELKTNALENILFNLPPGDWASGERGTTCLPGREEEFRAGVATAIEYAKTLNTPRLHAMAGVVPQGINPTDAKAAYVANLKFAATELAKHNLTLLIEAINTRDIPGFFLNTQAQAFDILQEVNAENLMLQMDLYHMQIMEGDLAIKLSKYAARCGHVQVAGVPKRNEPNTGEVHYPFLYDHLDAIGYSGWIGCEYRPAANTTDGLSWFNEMPTLKRQK